MSEDNNPTNISVEPTNSGNANLIYILYLVGLVVGITSIVGVVMAYLGKGEAPDWLQSHYNHQINIFWKFFLYMIIGIVLSVVLIGILVMLFAVIWYIVRIVKGMQKLGRGEAYDNPGSWGF